MKTFSRNKNIFKSFYHQFINDIKIWDPKVGEGKKALLALATVLLLGFAIAVYSDPKALLALAFLLLFILIDFLVYFLFKLFSKKYKVNKFTTTEDSLTVFYKDGSRKEIKYENILKLKYNPYIQETIIAGSTIWSSIFSFLIHFSIKVDNQEDVLIPFDIENLPELIDLLKKKANLKKKKTFVWEKWKGEKLEQTEEEKRAAPFNPNKEFSPRYLFWFMIILFLFLIYFYLSKKM